ncbi:MAG: carbohydrate ABC transporter permease [Acutalibacter sp.]|nr:carbohydrate ABC transporter permease [Acutalibacter sp.]
MALYTKEEKRYNWLSHLILTFFALLCIFPFYMLIIGSFTDNALIINQGYTFFPTQLSLDAYQYMGYMADTFVRAYGITVLTTAAGTAGSLFLVSTMGYGLSRKAAPGMKVLSFLVVFTMLFNGGLVSTYLIYTSVVPVKNSLWAYILPGLLLNAFHVLLMRSYVVNSIPDSLFESAQLDGAGQWTVYSQIVLPLSMPILATIGLLVGVQYWNSWQNGLYYITDTSLYSMMNILNRMLQDVRYLQSGAMGDYGGELMSHMPTNSVRMAIAVVGVLPILALYPFFQRYFVKGITLGSVKG